MALSVYITPGIYKQSFRDRGHGNITCDSDTTSYAGQNRDAIRCTGMYVEGPASS